jgi:hypothetical protein
MLDLIGLSNWVHLDEILVYYTQRNGVLELRLSAVGLLQ